MLSAHLFLSLLKHSWSPSVGSDGKDKIGYFQDNGLFEIQTTLRRRRGTFERSETRGVAFIRLNVLEVRLSFDIKQQQPRNQHHSKDCNGVSGCICLCK